MPQYRHRLSDGRFLTLTGDAPPTSAEIEAAARASEVFELLVPDGAEPQAPNIFPGSVNTPIPPNPPPILKRGFDALTEGGLNLKTGIRKGVAGSALNLGELRDLDLQKRSDVRLVEVLGISPFE